MIVQPIDKSKRAILGCESSTDHKEDFKVSRLNDNDGLSLKKDVIQDYMNMSRSLMLVIERKTAKTFTRS